MTVDILLYRSKILGDEEVGGKLAIPGSKTDPNVVNGESL